MRSCMIRDFARLPVNTGLKKHHTYTQDEIVEKLMDNGSRLREKGKLMRKQATYRNTRKRC